MSAYQIYLLVFTAAAIYSCSSTDEPGNEFTNLQVPAEAPLLERPLPPGQEHGYEIATNNKDSADYAYYAWLVDSTFINREQISGKSYEVQNFTTYLGMLYDLRDSTAYHVLRQFRTIQCAISKRGHSEVIFLGEKEKTCRIYEFDMPYELPDKIEKNALVFGEKGMSLKGGLPLMLCVPGGGCYE